MNKSVTVQISFGILLASAAGSCTDKSGGSSQVATTGAELATETAAATTTETSTATETATETATTASLAPEPATIASLPATWTRNAQISVTIGGERIAVYASRLAAGDQPCTDFEPTVFAPVATTLTLTFASDGNYTLCVLGRDAAGVPQATPTRALIRVDATAPTATIATSGTKAPSDAVGNDLVVSGTLADAGSGPSAASISVQKDGGANACLNDDKTAFDAACPNILDVTVGGSFSLPIPVALLTSGSTYTVSLVLADASGNATTTTSTFTWSRPVKLYLGVQESSGGAFVQQLLYNSLDNAVTPGATIDVSPYMDDQSLRSLADRPDGGLFAGGAPSGMRTPGLASITADATAAAGPTIALPDFHGVCVLPNGNIIAAAYSSGGGGVVKELDASGTYLRDVATTTTGTMVDCVAASNTEVLFVDYDADNDNDGDVVKVTFNGTSWSVAQRWDQSAANGIAAGSSIYALVLHTNGDLYVAPQNGTGSRNRKLIHCQNRDLTLCGPIGTALPWTGADGFLQGMVQIPGNDDLLLVSSAKLIRYDVATGVGTALSFDPSSINGLDQVRLLRAR